MGTAALAQEIDAAMESYQECLLAALETAASETSIGQIRTVCAEEVKAAAARTAESAMEPTAPAVAAAEPAPPTEEPISRLRRRQDRERELSTNPFALTAHRPNYFLFAAYNAEINAEPFTAVGRQEGRDFDHLEGKFQLSLKFPLAVGLFDGRTDLHAGYTGRSFWQIYNSEESRPFRETNHEPEIWLSHNTNFSFMGWRNVANQFGLNHHSNGRGGTLSRSWNRLFANIQLEKGDFGLNIKPWWRIPEDKDQDENRDITDFLGHGEIRGSLKHGNQVFSVMLRNHFESNFSKGTTELGWSFAIPQYQRVRAYFQVFNGYGESLIDYNFHKTSVGFGLMLNDLQ